MYLPLPPSFPACILINSIVCRCKHLYNLSPTQIKLLLLPHFLSPSLVRPSLFRSVTPAARDAFAGCSDLVHISNSYKTWYCKSFLNILYQILLHILSFWKFFFGKLYTHIVYYDFNYSIDNPYFIIPLMSGILIRGVPRRVLRRKGVGGGGAIIRNANTDRQRTISAWNNLFTSLFP